MLRKAFLEAVSWATSHPVRLALIVIFTLVFAGMMCGIVLRSPDVMVDALPKPERGTLSEPATPTMLEIPPAPPASSQTPTDTSPPTPTLQDNVRRAVVRVTSCEEEPCGIPLWQEAGPDREAQSGSVEDGSVVDVLSCYYPVVMVLAEETPENGAPVILTPAVYEAEGLWCEVVYTGEEGTAKGMLQYWFLDFGQG